MIRACATWGMAIAAIGGAFGVCSARAGVIDLRDAARQTPGLIHQYTFETYRTDLNAPRLFDQAGTADLLERYGSSIPNPGALTYGAGFDALSAAGTSVYVSNVIARGRAWTSPTNSAMALPSEMTVECVVRVNELPYPEAALVASRPASDNRGYYLWLNSGGDFGVRVGTMAASRTILAGAATGHWYYVASTFTASGGQTTINSYVANLTTGGALIHALTNVVGSGTYGTSAILGIGVLFNLPAGNSLQYFAPCSFDEVALYNTAHSTAAISNRWAALRLATPSVEYRELFPNDTNTAARAFPREGWQAHSGADAAPASSALVEEFNTAFDEDLPAVASLPGDTGVSQGYLNNHVGPTANGYLYWTDEMVEPLDVGWLKRIDFDTRTETNYTLRVALRVDTNATPALASDDAWFVSADFLRRPGTSVFAVPTTYSVWLRWLFEVGAAEWAALAFVPGSALARGGTQAALPTNGLVTAFGLFQDLHAYTKNLRVDNVTLHARRVYPPPPPRGTLFLLF